jgi:hypothetical protein
LFWDLAPCTFVNDANVSEKHTVSIFRAEVIKHQPTTNQKPKGGVLRKCKTSSLAVLALDAVRMELSIYRFLEDVVHASQLLTGILVLCSWMRWPRLMLCYITADFSSYIILTAMKTSNLKCNNWLTLSRRP